MRHEEEEDVRGPGLYSGQVSRWKNPHGSGFHFFFVTSKNLSLTDNTRVRQLFYARHYTVIHITPA